MQNAIGAKHLTNIQKFAPPATLGLAGKLAALTGSGGKGPLVLHNCLVTNIPGPATPLYMLGARLVHWGGVGPVTDGLSLIWNPSSYCGKLFISLTSSPNVVPDPEFLARCLRDSFEEMKAAAAARKAPLAVEEALSTKVMEKKVPTKKRPARKVAAATKKAPVRRAAQPAPAKQ
jgi:hypothetical protein